MNEDVSIGAVRLATYQFGSRPPPRTAYEDFQRREAGTRLGVQRPRTTRIL